MYEYYVERLANETGNHVVHRSSCSALPAIGELHYIGVRSNIAAPLNEAANWFSTSTPCPDCIPAK